jgi:hypothetical protein
MKIFFYFLTSFLFLSNYYLKNKDFEIKDGIIRITSDSTALFIPNNLWYDTNNLSFYQTKDSIVFNSYYKRNKLNENFVFHQTNEKKQDSVKIVFQPKNLRSEIFASVNIYNDSFKLIHSFNYLFNTNSRCFLPDNL